MAKKQDKIILNGKCKFPTYWESYKDYMNDNSKNIINIKQFRRFSIVLKDNDNSNLMKFVKMCLHDKSEMMFNFYIIISQIIILNINETIEIPIENKILERLINDAGIIELPSKISLFFAIKLLNREQLDYLLKIGNNKYGFKIPNDEYRKFISNPEIKIPYSFTNKNRKEIHRGDNGLFFNKREKNLMDSPIMLKLFLRAVFYYFKELEIKLLEKKVISTCILRDIAIRTAGNMHHNVASSNNNFLAVINFFLHSNVNDLIITIKYFDSTFENELKQRILFKPIEIQSSELNHYFDSSNDLNYFQGYDNEKLYKINLNETFINCNPFGGVNLFFGKQFPQKHETNKRNNSDPLFTMNLQRKIKTSKAQETENENSDKDRDIHQESNSVPLKKKKSNDVENNHQNSMDFCDREKETDLDSNGSSTINNENNDRENEEQLLIDDLTRENDINEELYPPPMKKKKTNDGEISNPNMSVDLMIQDDINQESNSLLLSESYDHVQLKETHQECSHENTENSSNEIVTSTNDSSKNTQLSTYEEELIVPEIETNMKDEIRSENLQKECEEEVIIICDKNDKQEIEIIVDDGDNEVKGNLIIKTIHYYKNQDSFFDDINSSVTMKQLLHYFSNKNIISNNLLLTSKGKYYSSECRISANTIFGQLVNDSINDAKFLFNIIIPNSEVTFTLKNQFLLCKNGNSKIFISSISSEKKFYLVSTKIIESGDYIIINL
ncbi:putative uncharacterized protein DDB_G0282499 isoform X2 [Leptopilina heterotoma]|uniref:putative uncharacterized protein DDB_G0282499 isoform X2 n=1 Tax=Leptopilina heterotoma TaxID=63436 RepID=UPI001CA7EAED|nr:putative uncharacterized protein DDB_G0282499 isoform X2 [Leptopilina heterotoma]